MKSLSLALVSSSPNPSLAYYQFNNSPLKNPTFQITIPRNSSSFGGSPVWTRSSRISNRSSRLYISARTPQNASGKFRGDSFARITSSKTSESVGVNPNVSVPPPPSSIGSPLFWIGVGVAFSAAFSWAASALKKYAMQQAMKTMMSQMNTQKNPFNNANFSPGSPFPFPTPPSTRPASSPSRAASQASVDVPATKVEAAPASEIKKEAPASAVNKKVETEKKERKYAFVDVSPEETVQESPFGNFDDVSDTGSFKNAQFFNEVSQNGAASKQGFGASDGPQSTKNAFSGLSVDALEKMMEDPTVQKMVFPYLPEEMRNPETFKWMLQNPQYRQQLQDMLNNMSGSEEWDSRMMDTMKGFDLNSPEVKQQFDQIGLTPEEVISKIMANPEVAMAFQNPRVQQAIMECSQNPLSIAKYQNDKEVMDVFNKISELFPGATGSF